MRWAAVATLTLAVGSACGGRSEYFDGYSGNGGADAGEDSGGTAGLGGTTGVGGSRGGVGAGPAGGTSPRGGGPAGGVSGTSFGGTGFGGTGVGGTGAGGGPRGGTSAGGVPTGGVGPTGGVPTGGSSVGGSSIGGSSIGGTGTGGRGGTMTGGRGGTNTGGTGGQSPENCLDCITMSCPEANQCFANPMCIEGLLCGAAACGGLEGAEALRCWTTCFDNDARLALQALTAAICLSQRCAVACQGF